MKKVKWLGEEREIPNVGVGTLGSILSMSDKDADSFIQQGLAEEVSTKPTKQVSKKEGV